MANIETRTHAQPKAAAHAPHPTAKTFFGVGAVLFVITAIEFGIVYVEGIRNTIIAILVLLSMAKFYLVANYFMHLKFDHKFLSWAFWIGLALATLITIAQKFVNLA